jgi:putative tryptophan/tyrosine transport system substrate-binding protein
MLTTRIAWIVLGLWLLLLATGPAAAAGAASAGGPESPARLLMLASDEGTLHQRVLVALERQIGDSPLPRERAVADTPEGRALVAAFDCGDCLIVTSGVAALRFALTHSRRAEVLAITVPEDTFERITNSQVDDWRISAIYMDVSLERMIALIHERLPDVQAVGIVSGDGRYLERERARGDLPDAQYGRLLEYHAGRESDMVDVFRRAGHETEAILAIPDPSIYNRDTIVRIMLTTYRTGTPLIGYSESMNRAGALMSVFASPEMLGEEAGRMITAAFREGRWRSVRHHTERHTVVINQQVARSLGIRVKDSP